MLLKSQQKKLSSSNHKVRNLSLH